ncbi:hypothetical protein FAM23868_001978 [Propionibacterium freudenreichii]|uniref:hypothetical protein n=1 Tax=Propionibacterium freudenreichii TaxID=1744 RepID=UPI0025500551|nr:hypothetical protein [Propionibacterium freudenreichii]MDK9332638.1 hypothetical protein [Propionibacterium freudenreichii]
MKRFVACLVAAVIAAGLAIAFLAGLSVQIGDATVAGPQASVVCSLTLVLIVEIGLPRHKEC